MHLSLPKRFPLFILASSVCWSLQCLISTLTQGGGGGHFLGSLVQSCCGEGGTLQTNHWRVWGVLSVFQPHWVYPCSQRVCFPGLHFSGSRLLCRQLSEVGPGLHALPMSKLLRFRFSGTPQRHRLGWACILCLSQVGAQLPTVATDCLPHPSCSVFWVYNRHAFSGVPVSLLGS